ncbi:MAG: flagellar basal-body MS-ring/collar protein FliF [Bacillota bacterium]
MNERLEQMRNQGLTVWQALDTRKRIAVVAISVAVLIGLLSLAVFTGKDDYVPLYTGLTTADAYEVMERLKSDGIPYRLADEGKTILVPSLQKHELRLQLASEGIPQGGGAGFELFDTQGFGVTEFTQRVNYRRALEGELAKTFAAFEQVEYAKVMLAIPEPTLYSDEEEPVTASVSLKLKPGRTLSQAQIRGIVHLASAAVEGLKPSNVTIVDTSGNILWIEDDSESAFQNRLSVAQLEAKERYEKSLQASIESMLEKVVGPGNVAVRVNAVFNFDQEQSHSEILEPVIDGAGAVISEQTYAEETRGPSVWAEGVPGTATNVDGDVPIYQAITDDQYSTSTRSEEIRNYEYSRTVTRVERGPGRIERLSVSALIHSAGLTEDDTERVRAIIAAAAGIDESRGDEIVVHTMAFRPRLSDEELAQMELEAEREAAREALRQYIKLGVPAFLGLIALIFGAIVIRTMRRQVYRDLVPEGLVGELELAAGEDEAEEEEELLGIPDEEKSPEERQRKAILKNLERMADENPEEVARLIRGWLLEE